MPAAVVADDGLKTRLARLEDEAAIRELHQTWLRRINISVEGYPSGRHRARCSRAEGAAADQGVRNIAADHTGEPDAIDVAADGTRAVGRFQCAVEIENAITQDCTLALMAHAQGSGFVRRGERRVLKVEYVKTDGAWAIAKIEFASI